VEPIDMGDDERESGNRALYELVSKFSDTVPEVHVLAGNPDASLPVFAKRRSYDAMLLGALTHQPGVTAQVGTLTSKLVEALECDFILVKPGAYSCPVGESYGRPDSRTTAPAIGKSI
jgi:nucleotide-binding universal stress UspA family protein